MRFRGVHHVEVNVPNYEKNLLFYDRMFGYLGYSSFGTLGIEYISTYYVAFPHSYIGIQPAKSQESCQFEDFKPGINPIALHTKNRKEIRKFYKEFLLKRWGSVQLRIFDVLDDFHLFVEQFSGESPGAPGNQNDGAQADARPQSDIPRLAHPSYKDEHSQRQGHDEPEAGK